MPYRITIVDDADRQFRALSARDRRIVESAIASRLQGQPAATSNAIKRLRPNPVATYELRVGDHRVFYNVDEADSEVMILLIGLKVGETLLVEGEVFREHQAPPP